jgi:hypothetical protein
MSSRGGRRTGSFGGTRDNVEMLDVDVQDFEDKDSSSSQVISGNNKSIYSSGGGETQESMRKRKKQKQSKTGSSSGVTNKSGHTGNSNQSYDEFIQQI